MATATGIGVWLRKTYDRLIAAVVLLVLLVSLILLALQVQVEKNEQKRFDLDLKLLRPRFATVKPVDKTIFNAAVAALAAPVQNEIWRVSLLTPELRVHCVNCDRPIPYSATNCTFTQCAALQPDTLTPVDKNKNSIPDSWEEKFGVFAYDPDVMNQDPDNDGFTTREEYLWKTDPKDPASHPPYMAKMVVDGIRPKPFRLIFQGVSRADKIQIFQINLRGGGRTYYKKLGEKAEGFTVESYDEHAAEGPTLTLAHNGKKIPLIMLRAVPRDEYEIKLVSLMDGSTLTVQPDMDFDFKGNKYRVKKVDTQRSSVLITDVSSNLDVWVEKRAAEAPAEVKK